MPRNGLRIVLHFPRGPGFENAQSNGWLASILWPGLTFRGRAIWSNCIPAPPKSTQVIALSFFSSCQVPAVFCSFRAIDSGLDSFVYYFLSEGWSHSYSYYRKRWAICRLYSGANGVVTFLLLFRFLCRKHGAIISSVETLDLRITATSWLWDGFDLWFATKSCQRAANQTKCQIKVKEMIWLVVDLPQLNGKS